MSVRNAKFADIPRLAFLIEEAHGRSIYAGKATFEPQEAKQLCLRAIQRHGHMNLGGTLFLVAEKDGQVEGFIIGLLDNVYPCLKELVVTDLFFIFSERANPRDAITMLKQLIKWGEDNPKVIEIHLGVTSAIGDWERTAKLYERLGLQKCGAMFRKEVSHV